MPIYKKKRFSVVGVYELYAYPMWYLKFTQNQRNNGYVEIIRKAERRTSHFSTQSRKLE